MNKTIINKVRLGIFVTAGLIILGLGIYFVGKARNMFNSTFRTHAVFKDVNGLQVGNNVRFAGINVGSIEGIEIIDDSSVQVEMIIDSKTQKVLHKDAMVSIGSDGLMGNKIVNIFPGHLASGMLEENDPVKPIVPINFDEMLLTLKKTIDNASEITGDLASIMKNIKTGRGTIGKLFMDTNFADNLDKSILNVKQGTKGFKQNMDAAKQSIFLRGYFKKKDPVKKKE